MFIAVWFNNHMVIYSAGECQGGPAVPKGWTDEMTVRFDTINGLPGMIVSGPAGLIQTTAFELDGDVIRAIYVVRNPDKLRHLTPV